MGLGLLLVLMGTHVYSCVLMSCLSSGVANALTLGVWDCAAAVCVWMWMLSRSCCSKPYKQSRSRRTGDLCLVVRHLACSALALSFLLAVNNYWWTWVVDMREIAVK